MNGNPPIVYEDSFSTIYHLGDCLLECDKPPFVRGEKCSYISLEHAKQMSGYKPFVDLSSINLKKLDLTGEV